MSGSPTPKQLEVLRFVAKYRGEHGGVSPTLVEIGDALNKNRVTIFEHVSALRSKGLISQKYHRARSLELTDAGKALFSECPCCGRSMKAELNLTQGAGDAA